MHYSILESKCTHSHILSLKAFRPKAEGTQVLMAVDAETD